MLHELKTWPDPFASVLDGTKRHEVRKADRPFSVGDMVHLREFDPKRNVYTGRSVYALITYITAPGTWGMPDDVCVFSIHIKASSTRPAATIDAT